MTIHMVLFLRSFFLRRNARKCYVFKWLSLNDAVDGHQLQLPVHFLFESACTSVLILRGEMR